jgi:hypothetical protein
VPKTGVFWAKKGGFGPKVPKTGVFWGFLGGPAGRGVKNGGFGGSGGSGGGPEGSGGGPEGGSGGSGGSKRGVLGGPEGGSGRGEGGEGGCQNRHFEPINPLLKEPPAALFWLKTRFLRTFAYFLGPFSERKIIFYAVKIKIFYSE